jgi:glutathione S-transferase
LADGWRHLDRLKGLAAHPATRDYLERATARPAFVKAHADQIAHFAEADT